MSSPSFASSWAGVVMVGAYLEEFDLGRNWIIWVSFSNPCAAIRRWVASRCGDIPKSLWYEGFTSLKRFIITGISASSCDAVCISFSFLFILDSFLFVSERCPNDVRLLSALVSAIWYLFQFIIVIMRYFVVFCCPI